MILVIASLQSLTILVLVKSLTQLVTVNAISLLHAHLKMLTVLVCRLLNVYTSDSQRIPITSLCQIPYYNNEPHYAEGLTNMMSIAVRVEASRIELNGLVDLSRIGVSPQPRYKLNM